VFCGPSFLNLGPISSNIIFMFFNIKFRFGFKGWGINVFYTFLNASHKHKFGPFSSPKKFEPLVSNLVMLLKKNPNIKLGTTQLQEFINVQLWAYKLVSIPHGWNYWVPFSLDLK
jgi:hypothetical protein